MSASQWTSETHCPPRVHNFNAGPAALPKPVLERAQAELVDFRGTGMSLLEMSHRGAVYEAVHAQTQETLRAVLGISSDDHVILFMGGGARSQFALVPMNLLRPGQHAAYITTGVWSEKAFEEAQKLGDVREVWSSAANGHVRVPRPGEFSVDARAAYLHFTSNNTIYGTQYLSIPGCAGPDGDVLDNASGNALDNAPGNVFGNDAIGDVPLVCDMSSDILSRPVDVSRFALIYAGAQKNMGPAGVTVVIARRDMLERSPSNLAETFSYQKMAAQDSLLNTPPVFAIYMVGLVAQWVQEQGGMVAMAERNERKAALVYDAIARSDGFYGAHALPCSRSRMNVTFRIRRDAALEPRFVRESQEAGFVGLKGHRLVGGLRASIYNAVPEASVRALVDFMDDFARRWG